MLSWFATLGWLVRRVYWHPRVTASLSSTHVQPGSRFYAVYAGDRQVGTASLSVDTIPHGARLQARLEVRRAGGMTERHQLGMTLDSTLAAQDWSYQLSGVRQDRLIRARHDSAGWHLSLQRPGAGNRDLLVADSGAAPLMAALFRRALRDPLAAGDSLALAIIGPASGMTRQIGFHAFRAGTLTVSDSAEFVAGRWQAAHLDTVPVTPLMGNGFDAGIEIQLDRQGLPVRVTLPNGLMLVQGAYEITHLNYRNGVANVPDHPARTAPAMDGADTARPEDLRPTLVLPSSDSVVAAIRLPALAAARTRADSVGALLRWMAGIRETPDGSDDALDALRARAGSPTGRARLFVTLARHAGLPARLAVVELPARRAPAVAVRPQVFDETWQLADLRLAQFPARTASLLRTRRASGFPLEYEFLIPSAGDVRR